MKWEGNRESDNVEDRRGSGGGFPLPGGRGIGIGTIVIALLGGWLLGINPLTLLGLLSGAGGPPAQVQQAPAQRPPADDTLARFVSTVLADTEDVWHGVFRQAMLARRMHLVPFALQWREHALLAGRKAGPGEGLLRRTGRSSGMLPSSS